MACVGMLLSDAKAHCWDRVSGSILKQAAPLAFTHLYLIPDDGNAESSGRAEAFKTRYVDRFHGITILKSHPIWRGSYHESPYRTGRIALLRQQILARYIADGFRSPLLWWDDDLEWNPSFVSTMIAQDKVDKEQPTEGWRVRVCVYASRGQLTPALFDMQDGPFHHVALHGLGGLTHTDFGGGGGLCGTRLAWEAFHTLGGWRDYARFEGLPCEAAFGEDCFVAHALGCQVSLVHGPSAWHWCEDKTALMLSQEPGEKDYAFTLSGGSHRSTVIIDDFSFQAVCRTQTERCQQGSGPVTVAVDLSDLESYALTALLGALVAQKGIALSAIRLLFTLPMSSRIALPHLKDWASSEGRRFSSVEFRDRDAATPSQHYLTLTEDLGVLFWAADMLWPAHAVARFRDCGWPAASGIYLESGSATRSAHVDSFGRSTIPISSLLTSPTCSDTGEGGLWLSRRAAKIRTEGGSIEPVLLLHDVLGERTSGGGVRCRPARIGPLGLLIAEMFDGRGTWTQILDGKM